LGDLHIVIHLFVLRFCDYFNASFLFALLLAAVYACLLPALSPLYSLLFIIIDFCAKPFAHSPIPSFHSPLTEFE
jgi:hypothetical protein